MKRLFTLALFIFLVVGGGLMIGFITRPTLWYANLAKPWFNPPSWIFAPVWTTLYILIAVAGWHTFEREPAGLSMRFWLAQLALNFAWSPIFFGAHQISIALLVIVILLIVILAFIVLTWRDDPVAARLFIPYSAWVMFASVLNGAIWLLN